MENMTRCTVDLTGNQTPGPPDIWGLTKMKRGLIHSLNLTIDILDSHVCQPMFAGMQLNLPENIRQAFISP